MALPTNKIPVAELPNLGQHGDHISIEINDMATMLRLLRCPDHGCHGGRVNFLELVSCKPVRMFLISHCQGSIAHSTCIQRQFRVKISFPPKPAPHRRRSSREVGFLMLRQHLSSKSHVFEHTLKPLPEYYVCIYIYTHTYIYYTHNSVCISACLYARTYACMDVCMHVCVSYCKGLE